MSPVVRVERQPGGADEAMTITQTRSFRRHIGDLESLHDYLAAFVAEYNIADAYAYVIQLAIEELFTNLVKYDPHADPEIPVRLTLRQDRLVAELINAGGAYFDVSNPKVVDVDRPLQERRVGGLGLHLVKHLVDDFRYDYKDGTGTITIAVSLEEKRA